MLFLIFIFNAIVVGGFCAYVASEKNRSGASWFILGVSFSFLALFALMAVPKIEKSDDVKESNQAIGDANAENKIASTFESFQGDFDISSGKYQLFLTKRFNIEKNLTLEKYVVDDQLFLTLDDALAYAHNLHQTQVLQKMQERLKYAYLIRELVDDGKAKLAGVMSGDIIISYNKFSITSNEEFSAAIAELTKPDTLMHVIREGVAVSIPVPAGRLGVNGEIVYLDEISFAVRNKILAEV